MEAPNKIYVPPFSVHRLEKPFYAQDIVYIRKDALLEMAERYEKAALNRLMDGKPNNGELGVWRRIIEKINSM